jgi:hypothetical protein
MRNDKKNLPERTYQYGHRAIALSDTLPNTKLAQPPGMHMLRAGTSLGANYSEADFGRGNYHPHSPRKEKPPQKPGEIRG